MEEMTEVFGKESHQIKAKPGTLLLLFAGEHPRLPEGRTQQVRRGSAWISELAEGMYGDLLRLTRAEDPGRLFPT